MARPVRFTEEMAGWLCPGAPDYAAGWHNGREVGGRAMFRLTIGTDDLERFLADPDHECDAAGHVSAAVLGGERLPVVRGRFNLFAPAAERGRAVMRYRLWFASGSGEPLTLVGFKDVGNDPGIDLWRDTTALYTRVLAGHVEAAGDDAVAEVARGMLVIEPAMFARQLTTFRGHPVAVARFGWMFLRSLLRLYGRRPSPTWPR